MMMLKVNKLLNDSKKKKLNSNASSWESIWLKSFLSLFNSHGYKYCLNGKFCKNVDPIRIVNNERLKWLQVDDVRWMDCRAHDWSWKMRKIHIFLFDHLMLQNDTNSWVLNNPNPSPVGLRALFGRDMEFVPHTFKRECLFLRDMGYIFVSISPHLSYSLSSAHS